MKKKANRLDAIKMIISSKEVGSQEELLQELGQEGFELTQATLSRDLKQLKVAKAASMNGKYVDHHILLTGNLICFVCYEHVRSYPLHNFAVKIRK